MFLIIFPSIVLVTSLRLSPRLFYVAGSDPIYVYLMNSLMIATLHPPEHIHHPGTTLQTFGAAVLRLTHLFMGKMTLTKDVINSPEFYLHCIYYSIVIVKFVLMFLSSWMVWTATRSLIASLLFQIAPYVSSVATWTMFFVMPEPFYGAFLYVFSALLIQLINRPMGSTIEDGSEKNTAFFLGIVYGFISCTKILCAATIIVPFLFLRAWRNRLILIVSGLVSFFVFLVPALPNVHKFWSFFQRISTHSGLYGSGKKGIIDPQVYLFDLWSLVKSEWAISVLICTNIFIAAMIYWFEKRKGVKPLFGFNGVKLLTMSLFLCLQLFIVAKMPKPHYLLPALGMLSVNFVMILQITSFYGSKFKSIVSISLFIIVCVVSSYAHKNIINYAFKVEMGEGSVPHTVELEKLEKFISEHPDYIIIQYFQSPTKAYALWFGDQFTGRRFSNDLEKKYQGNYFYNIFGQRYASFKEFVKLDHITNQGDKILFVGWDFGVLQKMNPNREYIPKGLILEPVYKNFKHYGLYRLQQIKNDINEPGDIVQHEKEYIGN